MTRQSDDNFLESLLDEALSPQAVEGPLVEQILAQTQSSAPAPGITPGITPGSTPGSTPGITPGSPPGKSPCNLLASGFDLGDAQAAASMDGLLTESLGTLPESGELVERIMAQTEARAAGVIAKIGPVSLSYNLAFRMAAAVVLMASLGVMMQAWGIGSDAYQIVQANRQLTSLIQYAEPNTSLDQQMDMLSVEINQLARGDDWESTMDDLDQVFVGLEVQLGTAKSMELF